MLVPHLVPRLVEVALAERGIVTALVVLSFFVAYPSLVLFNIELVIEIINISGGAGLELPVDDMLRERLMWQGRLPTGLVSARDNMDRVITVLSKISRGLRLLMTRPASDNW